MKYSAICFDLDGVIVNSELLHEAAFRSTLKHYNLSLSEDDYKTYFAGKTDKQGFIDYLSSLQVTLPLTDLLTLKGQLFASLAPEELSYYESVPNLVKNLAGTTTLALVTGSSPEETEIALKGQNLSKYFSVVITARDITYSKPNPEGYLLAATQLGNSIAPATCIAVEDSPSGVRAAKAAGMYCIAVTNTHTAEMLQMADVVTSQLKLSTFTKLLSV